jgi:hypothetical protein
MSKTFILAFNHDEAKNYIRKNAIEDRVTILYRPEQLFGTRNATVIVLPNAYRRNDYTDMMDTIRTRQGNIVR